MSSQATTEPICIYRRSSNGLLIRQLHFITGDGVACPYKNTMIKINPKKPKETPTPISILLKQTSTTSRSGLQYPDLFFFELSTDPLQVPQPNSRSPLIGLSSSDLLLQSSVPLTTVSELPSSARSMQILLPFSALPVYFNRQPDPCRITGASKASEKCI